MPLATASDCLVWEDDTCTLQAQSLWHVCMHVYVHVYVVSQGTPFTEVSLISRASHYLCSSVNTDVIHVLKWTRPPPSVFAHCNRYMYKLDSGRLGKEAT